MWSISKALPGLAGSVVSGGGVLLVPQQTAVEIGDALNFARKMETAERQKVVMWTIPSLRQQLVNELMAARRAVGTAADDAERRAARRRVHDAKVALGERGRAWWLDASPADLKPRIRAAIRTLLRSRREGATICPSEPARIVDGQSWRRLLAAVREQAVRLARAGHLVILRGGMPAAGDLTRGVLRYAPADTSSGRRAPDGENELRGS